MVSTLLDFLEEYKKLNKEQQQAVETIEGPVMVVAGPGTGKTQILALRIANILKKTDIKADGILCLTFTNSAVSAMTERLEKYIGSAASKVNIFTFHSFGMKVIEEYYEVLGLSSVPKLLEDSDLINFFGELLHEKDWKYIRPRSDETRYYSHLKSLISILKRERISPQECLTQIEAQISILKSDPDNLSSRGESKGKLKQEVLKKLEGLERTEEAAKFFDLYEKTKKERNFFDYDDILENLVKLSENEDVRADIAERYLYVLVDEHQDSSGIQNKFLESVWGEVEEPNIFVVGDDRQLIYGFGGASLAYFESFKHTFGKAKLITLVENYRSTQLILDIADSLLKSSLSKERLRSQSRESHPIKLVECNSPRDEIIASGFAIKEKIKARVRPSECVILVPKNKQVREATPLLIEMGLSVSVSSALSLLSLPEAQALLRILKIINNPKDSRTLALSFFYQTSLVDPIALHKFFSSENMRNFSLENFKDKKLFDADNPVERWIEKLNHWVEISKGKDLAELLGVVGKELLPKRTEITEAFLELASSQAKNNPDITLSQFLGFIERLETYNEDVSMTPSGEGVRLLTLHGSKGLEFDFVWIAHMDQKSLTSGRGQAFVMPDQIEEKIEKKDEEVYKRHLYVAITRAKRFCTISYATNSDEGEDQELAQIVAELPERLLSKETFNKEEKEEKKDGAVKKDLAKIVAETYTKRNISVSLLNNFFECPWKWYFVNFLQLPEPKSEILEFGNAVHASIDKILKMASKPGETEISKIVEEEVLKRDFGSDKTKERMIREITEIMKAFVKNRLPELTEKFENEKSILVKSEKFPHLQMYGKIDLLEWLPEGGHRVVDFKTGSVRRKSEIEKMGEDGRMSNYLRQLTMYSFLMSLNLKYKDNFPISRLEFLEAKFGKDAFYDRAITGEEIALLVKDIQDYDNLVRSGGWLELPCNYNSYGKNTECPYCELATIYQ